MKGLSFKNTLYSTEMAGFTAAPRNSIKVSGRSETWLQKDQWGIKAAEIWNEMRIITTDIPQNMELTLDC